MVRTVTPDDANRMTVAEAARLLNASEQFVRIGLQQGTLKFGFGVKMSRNWTYVITKQKFEEVTGIKVDNKEKDGASNV